MADNTTFQTTVATPPSGLVVATRQASHAGDTADIQLVTLAAVTGSEGSYTVREVFYADDAAFTPGTGGVLATGHIFDDTAPDSVDEGDIGISRMSANRNIYVQVRDNAGNERGLNVDASGNITVNVTGTVTVGSHAVTNAGTFAVQVDGSALTALQLIDDIVYADDGAWTGDTSKHALAGGIYQSTPQTITDGRTAPFNMTVNGAMHVAVQGTVTVGSHAVTNAGTFAVQVDGSALTALQLIDDTIFTDDAAFTLTSSKVSMAGAMRDDALGALAAAEGDAVPLRVDANGALWVRDDVLEAALSGSELQVDVVAALPAGTNAIGKLAANSGVDIGDVDVTSIAAGTNIIGATYDPSGLMIENSVSVTVKRAAIAAASSGDNTVVSGVANKKIRVLSMAVIAAGSVNLYFTSNASGTVVFGGSTNKINLVANTGFVLPYNPHGWFEVATDGHNLIMNLSAAIAVSGGLTYIEAE